MTLTWMKNEHVLKILFNSLMRELVRCCNQFKEESTEHMHFQIGHRESNVPMGAKLALLRWGEKSVDRICLSLGKNDFSPLSAIYNL